MAEGLRPHHHQEFEYHTVQYFDKKRHVIVKKIQYMCMIQGWLLFIFLKRNLYDQDYSWNF